ncbi:hypothetical protein QQ045_026948 [Rhodiola kirilowii]
MLTSSDGVSVESFLNFKDDKFISRRLTNKLTIDTCSTSAPECYHAGSQATVPFTWESQPGTPKHRLPQTPLPPLAPPPSCFYHMTSTTGIKQHSSRMHSSKAVFPYKLSFLRRSHHAVRLSASSENSTQSLSSLSSTSASARSSHMTPLCDYYYSRRYGFTFEYEVEKEYFRSSSSGSPFLCFGSKKCNTLNKSRRSGGSYLSMVKRFLSASTP